MPCHQVWRESQPGRRAASGERVAMYHQSIPTQQRLHVEGIQYHLEQLCTTKLVRIGETDRKHLEDLASLFRQDSIPMDVVLTKLFPRYDEQHASGLWRQFKSRVNNKYLKRVAPDVSLFSTRSTASAKEKEVCFVSNSSSMISPQPTQTHQKDTHIVGEDEILRFYLKKIERRQPLSRYSWDGSNTRQSGRVATGLYIFASKDGR